LNAIWDHLLFGFKAHSLPADATRQGNLNQEIVKLEAHPEKREGIWAIREGDRDGLLPPLR
jgi:hypothetical protein